MRRRRQVAAPLQSVKGRAVNSARTLGSSRRRTLLSTFMVTSIDDSGPGSFRQAILDSNLNVGSNTIEFAIVGQGVQTILPVTPLPQITSSVLIDGTSQPGYTGTPLIELNGSQAEAATG